VRKLLLILLAFIAIFTYIREYDGPWASGVATNQQDELHKELIHLEIENDATF